MVSDWSSISTFYHRSPGGHLSPWQQDAILRILTRASLSVPMHQKKMFVQLFTSERYWLGCLDVLSPLLKEERDAGKGHEAYVEAVEIVLHLEDIALLDTYGKSIAMPYTRM